MLNTRKIKVNRTQRLALASLLGFRVKLDNEHPTDFRFARAVCNTCGIDLAACQTVNLRKHRDKHRIARIDTAPRTP